MLGRHGIALGLLVAALVAWTAMLAWTFAHAQRPSGLLVAVFPLGTSSERALATVVDAGGTLAAATWLPSAWLVAGRTEDFTGRLRGAGARWLAPAAPLQVLASGGCGLGPRPFRSVRSAADMD